MLQQRRSRTSECSSRWYSQVTVARVDQAATVSAEEGASAVSAVAKKKASAMSGTARDTRVTVACENQAATVSAEEKATTNTTAEGTQSTVARED